MKKKFIAGINDAVYLEENETLFQISHKFTPSRHIHYAVFADGENESRRAYREDNFGCDGELTYSPCVFTRDQIYWKA